MIRLLGIFFFVFSLHVLGDEARLHPDYDDLTANEWASQIGRPDFKSIDELQDFAEKRSAKSAWANYFLYLTALEKGETHRASSSLEKAVRMGNPTAKFIKAKDLLGHNRHEATALLNDAANAGVAAALVPLALWKDSAGSLRLDNDLLVKAVKAYDAEAVWIVSGGPLFKSNQERIAVLSELLSRPGRWSKNPIKRTKDPDCMSAFAARGLYHLAEGDEAKQIIDIEKSNLIENRGACGYFEGLLAPSRPLKVRALSSLFIVLSQRTDIEEKLRGLRYGEEAANLGRDGTDFSLVSTKYYDTGPEYHFKALHYAKEAANLGVYDALIYFTVKNSFGSDPEKSRQLIAIEKEFGNPKNEFLFDLAIARAHEVIGSNGTSDSEIDRLLSRAARNLSTSISLIEPTEAVTAREFRSWIEFARLRQMQKKVPRDFSTEKEIVDRIISFWAVESSGQQSCGSLSRLCATWFLTKENPYKNYKKAYELFLADEGPERNLSKVDLAWIESEGLVSRKTQDVDQLVGQIIKERDSKAADYFVTRFINESSATSVTEVAKRGKGIADLLGDRQKVLYGLALYTVSVDPTEKAVAAQVISGRSDVDDLAAGIAGSYSYFGRPYFVIDKVMAAKMAEKNVSSDVPFPDAYAVVARQSKDFNQAQSYYLMGIAKGSIQSMLDVGDLLVDGEKLPMDLESAARLASLARPFERVGADKLTSKIEKKRVDIAEAQRVEQESIRRQKEAVEADTKRRQREAVAAAQRKAEEDASRQRENRRASANSAPGFVDVLGKILGAVAEVTVAVAEVALVVGVVALIGAAGSYPIQANTMPIYDTHPTVVQAAPLRGYQSSPTSKYTVYSTTDSSRRANVTVSGNDFVVKNPYTGYRATGTYTDSGYLKMRDAYGNMEHYRVRQR